MATGPERLADLAFDPGCYRRAAALVAALSFGDDATCEDLLVDDPRGLAVVLAIMVVSALTKGAELAGTSFAQELQELAVAAALAAAEEQSW